MGRADGVGPDLGPLADGDELPLHASATSPSTELVGAGSQRLAPVRSCEMERERRKNLLRRDREDRERTTDKERIGQGWG